MPKTQHRAYHRWAASMALLFSLLNTLCAQLEWQRMPGPPGGYAFSSFGLGTGGKWLRFGASSGVYESGDSGLNWQWNDYPGSIHTEAALTLGSDGRLWYFDFDQLVMSADNGHTWTEVLDEGSTWTSTDVTSTTVLDNGAIMLGIRSGTIVRSTDSSRTAVNVLTVTGGLNVLSRDALTGHLYTWKTTGTTGQTNPIRRSTDNGLTWSIWENHALTTGKNLTGLAFKPDGTAFLLTNGNLLRSTDDGASWTELPFSASSIAITATGRLLAVDQNIVSTNYSRYSDDNGDSWQFLPLQQLQKFRVMPGGVILAEHRNSGMYRSTDDGLSWAFSAYGMPNHLHALQMQFCADQSVIAVSPQGVFYSENGATDWQLRRGTHLNTEEFFPGWQSAFLGDSVICAWWDDRLWRSSDKGLSWQDITPAQFTPGSYFLSLREVDGVMIIYFDPGGMNNYKAFRSEDSGQTWVDIGNIQINAGVKAPNGTFWAFNGGVNTLLKSTNRGVSWSTVATPTLSGGAHYIFPLPNGDILLLGGGKIYRSVNNGGSWTTTNNANMTNVGPAFAISTGQLIVQGQYFGTSDALFLSVDNGSTWTTMQEPPNYWADHLLFLSPDQRLWFGTGDGFWRSTEPVGDFLTLGGRVKNDLNQNCMGATAEPNLPNFLVKTVATNGQIAYAMSDATGYYRALATTGDTYQISAIPPNNLWETCSVTATIPANITSGNSLAPALPVKPDVLCPRLHVDVGVPLLRRCFDTRMAVNYRNTGTVAAPNARIQLILDPFLEFQQSSLPVSSQSGDTLWYELGTLPVNTNATFYLDLKVSCDATLGQMHCSEARITPDTLCTDWQGAVLKTRMECLGDSILLEIRNTGQADMTSARKWQVWRSIWSTFDSLLVAEGNFFVTAGGIFTQKIAATGDPRLLLRAPQEAGYPLGSGYAQAVLLNCDGSGHPAYSYEHQAYEPARDLLCQPNIGSFDPNDKTGYPEGIGAGHHIDTTERLTYRIRFQNTGTDTAFTVVVRDTLSPLLDIETLEIGASSHPMTVTVRGERELVFRFDNILLPDSNINEAASHGFVRYALRQKSGVPIGDVIRNRAGIYFDFNLPVMTNETWHTVGLPQVSGTKAAPMQRVPQILAYPSPALSHFWVEKIGSQPTAAFLELSDATGRLLQREVFSGGKMRIECRNLPAGLLLLTLKDNTGQVLARGRVMTQ